MSIRIGKDIFLVDVLGIPPYTFIENLTIGTLVSGFLGIAAVMMPILIGKLFFENQHAITEQGSAFFTSGINKYVTILVGTIYAFVLLTEFSSLLMRIQADMNSGPIPDLNSEGSGFLPMLLISIALLLTNLGLGLYLAWLRHQLYFEEV